MIRSALRPLLLALAAVLLAGRLQVVDRVQIDARQVADRRIEIARNRQVEDEQRPLIALGDDRPEIGSRDDRLARAGGADDQVGLDQQRVQIAPTAAACRPAARPAPRPASRLRLTIAMSRAPSSIR